MISGSGKACEEEIILDRDFLFLFLNNIFLFGKSVKLSIDCKAFNSNICCINFAL